MTSSMQAARSWLRHIKQRSWHAGLHRQHACRTWYARHLKWKAWRVGGFGSKPSLGSAIDKIRCSWSPQVCLYIWSICRSQGIAITSMPLNLKLTSPDKCGAQTESVECAFEKLEEAELGAGPYVEDLLPSGKSTGKHVINSSCHQVLIRPELAGLDKKRLSTIWI